MKNAICDKYKQEHCFLYILNTSLSDFESPLRHPEYPLLAAIRDSRETVSLGC